MPGGDRTGPDGLGPMTGRGFGYCAGNTAPGYTVPGGRGVGFGRGGGFGFGRGGGRGRRNMFYATGMPGWMRWGGTVPPMQPPVDERTALQQQKEALQQSLQGIEQRLNDLGDDAQ